MKRFVAGVLVALTSGGAAAAAVKPATPPAGAPKAETAFLAPRKPLPFETYAATPVPDTWFGVSGAMGSLGVGLLLGPIGVAGNVKFVQDTNKAFAAKITELTATDVAPMMLSLVRPSALEGPAWELTPSALVWHDMKTGRFVLGCTIRATLAPQKGRRPTALRYNVNLENWYDPAEPGAQAKAAASLPGCFAEAHRLFVGHVDGGLAFGAPRAIKVKSYMPTPASYTVTAPTLDAGPDRVIVNDALGVVSYRPSDVLAVE